MKGTLHAPFNFCFENIKFLQTTTSAKLVPQEQHSVVDRKCKNSQGVIDLYNVLGYNFTAL